VRGEFEEALRRRAADAGVELAVSHIDQLGAYYELLARWTRTINLTSLPLPGYPAHTIDRLVIEPLLAARFFRAEPPRWIDLGSGGGSPAIPLRVVRPGGSLEMVESRGRKASFLREAVRTLKLERTDVRTTRIEEFSAFSSAAETDLITMRAVKPTSAILHAAARLLKPGGRLFVFGALGVVELEDASVGDLGFPEVESVSLLEPEHRLFILTRG
jgi:16S rRNA (guanine527-N7)-methyltransferase